MYLEAKAWTTKSDLKGFPENHIFMVPWWPYPEQFPVGRLLNCLREKKYNFYSENNKKIISPKFYVYRILSQINLIITICLFKDLQFQTSI